MQKTVYYLVHRDTGERCFKPYQTLAGARIAQRARNHRLGFNQRIERACIEDNWEVERCLDSEGSIVDATYCIVEDAIDTEDLITLVTDEKV